MIRFWVLVICFGVFLTIGCKPRGPVVPAGLTIHLDGTIDKWLDKTPAWDNGPVPTDQRPKEFHISKVFFDNDSRFFYVFIQCSPTVQERYKITHQSGSLGGLFFDPVNNPDTGSPPSRRETNPNYRGYQIKVYLPTGTFSGTKGGGAFAGYDLFRFTGRNLEDNNGFNDKVPDSEQDSKDEGALIADGNDGVEMAIPLDLLGLKPGATTRIMIETSNLNKTLDLRYESGFATYHCR